MGRSATAEADVSAASASVKPQNRGSSTVHAVSATTGSVLLITDKSATVRTLIHVFIPNTAIWFDEQILFISAVSKGLLLPHMLLLGCGFYGRFSQLYSRDQRELDEWTLQLMLSICFSCFHAIQSFGNSIPTWFTCILFFASESERLGL